MNIVNKGLNINSPKNNNRYLYFLVISKEIRN
jgi:hypothetical protein